MITDYRDFEIVITKQGDQLVANLGAAPEGCHLSQAIPIELPGELVDGLPWFDGISEPELARLGHKLFNTLVRLELAENWHACLGNKNRSSETGLRLRFSIQADALTHIPFELLCRKMRPTRTFLALDPHTPVVRSPSYGGAVRSRSVELPLRMLVVIANPKLKEPIDFHFERASLEGALAKLIERKKLMIEYLGLPDHPKADFDTLHRTLALANYPYDIFHFVGHGAPPEAYSVDSEGTLLFVEPKSGRRQDVSASDLAPLLAHNHVRVAVLQACQSAHEGTFNAFQGMAQQIVARGLPAVVAMQYPVYQDVANWFCAQFYTFWLREKFSVPIEYAVTQARHSVRRKFRDQAIAWSTPTLFIRQSSTKVLRMVTEEDVHKRSLKRGRILLEQNEIDAAIDELETAYELVQEHEPAKQEEVKRYLADALVAQARIRRDEGSPQAAIQACERVLAISPDRPTAQEMRQSLYRQLADEAIEEGDLDKASEAYKQAGELEKSSQVEAQKQSQLGAPSQKEPDATQKSTPEAWAPSELVAERYEIIERLALTPTCEIYKAQDQRFTRRIAVIKRLKSEAEKKIRGRFEREIGILELIKGKPGERFVLSLLGDSGPQAKEVYFVTEFADLKSLKDYLQSKPQQPSPAESLEIAKSICLGIQAIHKPRLNIIHRDIKPANILLFSTETGGFRIKLADFSVAGVPEKWIAGKITVIKREFVGTYAYAAPEQIFLNLDDKRSDFFSWGVVLLEMLTGKTLMDILTDGTQDLNLYIDHCRELDQFPLTFFTDLGVPEALASILQKALCRAERRYHDVQDILDDLAFASRKLVNQLEQHLEHGKEYMDAAQWKRANDAFFQGQQLCRWSPPPTKLSGKFQEMALQLKAGHLYSQGMLASSQRRWQDASEAFSALLELCSDHKICQDLDVETPLERVKGELKREQRYELIAELEGQENWVAVVNLIQDLTKDYPVPDGRRVDDIHKNALYAQGTKFESEGESVRAHSLFYSLYKKAPNYRDIKAKCLRTAFESATSPEANSNLEQKIEWLERILEIDPDFEKGVAQQLLNQARHHWAEVLLEQRL